MEPVRFLQAVNVSGPERRVTRRTGPNHRQLWYWQWLKLSYQRLSQTRSGTPLDSTGFVVFVTHVAAGKHLAGIHQTPISAYVVGQPNTVFCVDFVDQATRPENQL